MEVAGFTAEQLAYCGIYCAQCSFKAAAETRKPEHLANMPPKYNAPKYDTFKQEVLGGQACPGCKGDALCGPDCKIKVCAAGQRFTSCADCDVFPCQILLDFANDGIPHHHWALENLQDIRENGVEGWFERFKPNLICDCGERLSWYYKCPSHALNPLQPPPPVSAPPRP
jgi:hypothetical protein